MCAFFHSSWHFRHDLSWFTSKYPFQTHSHYIIITIVTLARENKKHTASPIRWPFKSPLNQHDSSVASKWKNKFSYYDHLQQTMVNLDLPLQFRHQWSMNLCKSHLETNSPIVWCTNFTTVFTFLLFLFRTPSFTLYYLYLFVWLAWTFTSVPLFL